MSFLFPNYSRADVSFIRGQGAWLWDAQGKRYLDALSGIAVCSLGHAHPAISQAVCEQAQALMHTSNLYRIEQQEQLAEKLAAITGLNSVFFCNSGAEANEAAIKLARLYARDHGISTPRIMVMQGGFHGRTLGALSASDLPNSDAFAPLLEGFIRVAYNDVAAVEQAVSDNPDVCAIMLEPIQGENGIQVPDAGYLSALRAICDKNKLLLILDEVQTGAARTGKWYAFMHDSCLPDILTGAKALGNGIPIGVCLARQALAPLFSPGTHGSTFGGNPLACAAAARVLETIENDDLCRRADALGADLLATFGDRLGEHDAVVAVRGKGLMIGIELNRDCKSLQTLALQNGLLINVTADRVIRLLPPLILSDEQAALLVDLLTQTITNWTQQ